MADTVRKKRTDKERNFKFGSTEQIQVYNGLWAIWDKWVMNTGGGEKIEGKM